MYIYIYIYIILYYVILYCNIVLYIIYIIYIRIGFYIDVTCFSHKSILFGDMSGVYLVGLTV